MDWQSLSRLAEKAKAASNAADLKATAARLAEVKVAEAEAQATEAKLMAAKAETLATAAEADYKAAGGDKALNEARRQAEALAKTDVSKFRRDKRKELKAKKV